MRIRLIVPAIFFVIIFYNSYQLIIAEGERKGLKEDLIELSKIKYGLFSVDEWKKILSNIVAKKIQEFDLSGSDKKEMRDKISDFLYKVIGDFEKTYHRENSRTLGGLLKSGMASVFGAFDELKNEVPMFTDQIVSFINDPRNQHAIKLFLNEKIDEYADNTFSKIDYTTHNHILSKHKADNRADAIKILSTKISDLELNLKRHIISLIIFVALTILYTSFSKNLSNTEYLLLVSICLLLLSSGLFLPMIEIDARISEMSFTLLGEAVSFEDQVLYYKSKSILEVVSMMMSQLRLDLIFVGILVLLFSVLFPLMKMISSMLYIYSDHLKKNKFIRFMVFKTGKWSMADVMVIAIFMAYIGFSGIITEQLRQIETLTNTVEVLTTNKSSLLNGFYCFTTFAILSLMVSHKLQYQSRII